MRPVWIAKYRPHIRGVKKIFAPESRGCEPRMAGKQNATPEDSEFAVGFHVWLDSGLVVVVRADQVQKSNGLRRRPDPSDNTSE